MTDLTQRVFLFVLQIPFAWCSHYSIQYFLQPEAFRRLATGGSAETILFTSIRLL